MWECFCWSIVDGRHQIKKGRSEVIITPESPPGNSFALQCRTCLSGSSNQPWLNVIRSAIQTRLLRNRRFETLVMLDEKLHLVREPGVILCTECVVQVQAN